MLAGRQITAAALAPIQRVSLPADFAFHGRPPCHAADASFKPRRAAAFS